jgi:hypothetical protein
VENMEKLKIFMEEEKSETDTMSWHLLMCNWTDQLQQLAQNYLNTKTLRNWHYHFLKRGGIKWSHWQPVWHPIWPMPYLWCRRKIQLKQPQRPKINQKVQWLKNLQSFSFN